MAPGEIIRSIPVLGILIVLLYVTCPVSSQALCPMNQFECDSGACISRSWVCDIDDDCGDGSDERSCASCEINEFLCDNGRCIERSWVCDTDNDCGDGSDERSCGIGSTPGPTVTNITGRLLFTESLNNAIYSMDLQGGPHRLIRQFNETGQTVVGVAYNERTDVMFYGTQFTSGAGGRIGRTNVSTGEQEEIELTFSQGLTSIRVDPVSNLLFYATPTTIGVMSTDLQRSRVILERFLYFVMDIALNPYEGTIFWIDGRRTRAIGRASMDGSNFARIISTSIAIPTALAIDIPGGLLYWYDDVYKYAYSCDQNGNNKRRLFRYSVYTISAIAVDENYLYLGRLTTSSSRLLSLLRVRKSSTNLLTFGQTVRMRGFSSIFLDKSTRYLSGSNACSGALNGGCAPHLLCLPTGRNARTCACQNGYIAVNQTCKRNFTMALINGTDSLHGTLTFLYPTVNRTVCPTPGFDRIARMVCRTLGADGNNVSTAEVQSLSAGRIILNGCEGNETDIFQCVQFSGDNCPRDVWINCGVSGYVAPENNIFLANPEKGAVYSISINGSVKMMVPLSTSRPRGLAYDAGNQQLFFSQCCGTNRDLYRIDLNKMSTRRHIFPADAVVNAITLDPISKLIFYTNAQQRVLGVVSADFTKHRVLIDTDIFFSWGITLNPKEGWVFWTRRGYSAKIERAHMDGSSRTTIISTSINNPAALYYDIQGNYLYWTETDLERIYRCRSDGSSRSLLFSTSLILLAMVVDDKYLYAAVDTSTRTTQKWFLWKGLKDGSGELSRFGVNETERSYIGMALNVPSAHATESSCANPQNGGCPAEAMCLPTGVTTRVCMCSEGFIYNSNMNTCQQNHTLHLINGRDHLHGIVSVKYGDRTLPVCGQPRTEGYAKEAKVICRMLGYQGDNITELDPQISTFSRYTYFGGLSCDGSEENLAYCPSLRFAFTSCQFALHIRCGDTVEYKIPETENLFIADYGRGSIFSTNLTGGPQINITEQGEIHPYGLAYNEQGHGLYYSNVGAQGSYIAHINNIGNFSEDRHHLPPAAEVLQLAIDSLTGLLYYTESSGQYIGVFSLDFREHSIVVSNDLVFPHGIAVNPFLGDLFWTDSNSSKAHIGRATMAGTMQRKIITSRLYRPYSISVDLFDHYIYWCDAQFGRIERSRRDGSQRRVIYEKHGSTIYSLALDNQHIYFSTLANRTSDSDPIARIPLNGGGKMDVGHIYANQKIGAMVINTRSRLLNGKTACTGPNNGGCYDKHFCLPTGPTTRDCACSEGYKDDEQGLGCITNYTIQLVDGTDPTNGRVVVNYKGENRSVCIDNVIGNEVAMVVCRMLGFGDAYAKLEAFGTNLKRFWLHNVLCNGDEADIAACKHMMWGDWNTCPHESSLSVSCRPLEFSMELVDGPDSWHGRIHLKRAGQEGGLCYTPDIMVAKVICQTLGYEGADISMQDYGDGRSLALLNVTTCHGNETSIENCSHGGWGKDVFDCSSALGVNCGSPKGIFVLLVDGPDRLHGRLSVVNWNIFGTVCGRNFTMNEACVVCAILGYWGPNITLGDYGPGKGKVWLHQLQCVGNETDLQACEYPGWGVAGRNTPCTHQEDVGINCGPMEEEEKTTNELMVALEEGPDSLHGRLVLEVDGVYGTVCDDGFGRAEAIVVCRMLGYIGPASQISIVSYGGGSGPILLDEVNCQGTERDIQDCGHHGIGIHDCLHSEDVGINCGMPIIPLYVTGGPDGLHGRVMVLHEGMYGTICDDGFGLTDARAVCRILGYMGSSITYGNIYGPGSGSILLSNLACTGSENSIEDCISTGWGNHHCFHREDVSVNCGPVPERETAVRLVDGPDEAHGRVVLTIDGEDGMICGIPGHSNVARVICRMMGFGTIFRSVAASTQSYGRGEGKVWLENVVCSSSSTVNSILQCRHGGVGNRRYTCPRDLALGVNCGPPPELSVKLVGGPDYLHGQVIVTNNGREGNICDDDFSNYDARVICRMLGYTGSTYSVTPYTKYPGGIGYIWLDDLACSSSDTDLAECSHTGWGIHDCADNEVGGVDCGPIIGTTTQTPTEALPSLGLTLVDGIDKLHGVMVLNGQHVCAKGFTQHNAQVACRMLNYQGPNVTYAGSGEASYSFHPVSFACSGNEPSVFECSLDPGLMCSSNSTPVVLSCGIPEYSSLRLVGGIDVFHGRVEIEYNGRNLTLCSLFFTMKDATVLCRMLGYNESQGITVTSYGGGHGDIVESLSCNGDEDNIDECGEISTPNVSVCHHVSDVGLNCGEAPKPNVRVHLEGVDNFHGRVVLSVERDGEWVAGTMCNQSIVYDDSRNNIAKVICRMLGYQGDDVEAWKITGGKGHHWLTYAVCTGDETSISDCKHIGWGVDVYTKYCDHKHDLAVNCGKLPSAYLKLALVGGWDAYHGRVELTYQNITGSICMENFKQNEADMICRMVGYRGVQVRTSMGYGHGNGPTLVGGLKCFENASHITECSHRGWGVSTDSCSQHADVGIDCGPIINPMVSARLVDGQDELHGRVQVEVSNSTLQGSLCELGTLFGENQKKVAQVVCNNLGYRGEDVEAWLYPSNTTFIASNLMCTGNETSLRQCRNPYLWGNISKECKLRNTLHIGCGRKEDVWKVWTEGGEDQYHGRIMVSYHGLNGTVCGSGFSMNEAKVICRMLGYSGPMTNVSMTSVYGQASKDVILLDGLNCAGKENHISQCFHRGVGVYRSGICDNQPPAGVSCGLSTGPGDGTEPPKAAYAGTCGVRSPVVNKIYGGDIVDITSWPWMVSLQPDGRHFCGGSIIADQWIVTAAHCVDDAETQMLTKVVAGTSNIRQEDRVAYEISQIFIHPSYNIITATYDIALLRLRNKLQFSTSVRPICLNSEQDIPPEGPCYAVGWGTLHSYTNTPDLLRQALFRVVDDSRCREFLRYNPQNSICAGYANGFRALCQGDSGGPLLCKRKGVDAYDLYGVASKGKPCGIIASHAVFTDVSVFKSWIERTMSDG